MPSEVPTKVPTKVPTMVPTKVPAGSTLNNVRAKGSRRLATEMGLVVCLYALWQEWSRVGHAHSHDIASSLPRQIAFRIRTSKFEMRCPSFIGGGGGLANISAITLSQDWQTERKTQNGNRKTENRKETRNT